jgi:antitoxin CptB
MKMDAIVSQARLEWAAKRGMLECELFLVPFIKTQFCHLSEDEKSQLYELLQYPDPLLYGWFMKALPLEEEMLVFQNLIKKIRQGRGLDE